MLTSIRSSGTNVRSFGDHARDRFHKSLASKSLPHPRLAKLPSTMSVLVPLVVSSNKPSVLLTKRSTLMRSHRGEVCFPGGRGEPGETTEQTALRETMEEIGVSSSDLKIWGGLNPVATRHLTSTVAPIVAEVEKEEVLLNSAVSAHEVQTVFSIPVDQLCQNVRYTMFKTPKYSYKLPVFHTKHYKVYYHNKHNYLPREFRVWGLSAIILHQALFHIAPDEYKPNLQVRFY